MRTLRKALFPVLLIIDCIVVFLWQHYVASLPYLPKNGIVPLGILTPLLFVVTYFVTFVLLKDANENKAKLRSLFSVIALLVPVIIAAMTFLSYAARRYAGILPVIVLPDLANGIVTVIITALLVAHLTGLLIYRFVKGKYSKVTIAIGSVCWALFNVCMWLVTL